MNEKVETKTYNINIVTGNIDLKMIRHDYGSATKSRGWNEWILYINGEKVPLNNACNLSFSYDVEEFDIAKIKIEYIATKDNLPKCE